MHTSGKASQLCISLFVAAVAPLLLLRSSNFSEVPLWSQVAELLIFAVVIVLFFVPSYFLLKNTNKDIFIIAQSKTPVIAVFLSELYAVYFVFASVKILKNYTEMMTTAINPDADSYVVALCIMVVCIYAAVKGAGAVTRSGIFIFAIFIICFFVICFGNISKLELNNFTLAFNGVINKKNIFINLAPMLVVTPIFAVLCGNTTDGKGRALISFVSLTIAFTAIFMFFTTAVLGSFSSERRFSAFTLSKVSGVAGFSGFDSLYLIASVASVILLISLFLVSINKSVNKNNSFLNTLIFSVLIYVLYICSENVAFVSRIFDNEYIFISLTFIFAIAIPLGYLAKYGRNKYRR